VSKCKCGWMDVSRKNAFRASFTVGQFNSWTVVVANTTYN
jgi:hypothetical protein